MYIWLKIENALSDFFWVWDCMRRTNCTWRWRQSKQFQSICRLLGICWRRTIVTRRRLGLCGERFPPSHTTKLHQDKERVVDRLKFLKQKEGEGKKLKRLAALEQKKGREGAKRPGNLRGACPGACCKCNYAISYATEILLSSCLARTQKALPRIQGEQDVHLLLPGPPRNREELEGGCLRSRSILGLWRTLRRGPSGGWAATADDRLASKSWLSHCSEKKVCEHSGVPAGQCARNCCCILSCWLLLAGWLYSYKPRLLGDNSNILGNYIWTNHWSSGDIRSFSGE